MKKYYIVLKDLTKNSVNGVYTPNIVVHDYEKYYPTLSAAQKVVKKLRKEWIGVDYAILQQVTPFRSARKGLIWTPSKY